MSADDCVVFELGSTGVQTTAADADIKGVSAATSSRQLAGPLDELLQALLPADASIAVITRDASQLPRVGDCRAVSPPDGANDLRAMLEEADAGDAEFLVIPAGSYDRVHGRAEPAADVGGWRLVTHQRHLGEVYERSRLASEDTPSQSDAEIDDAPTADASLWQRIVGFFKR